MDKKYLFVVYKEIGDFNENDEVENCSYDDRMLNYFICFFIFERVFFYFKI